MNRRLFLGLLSLIGLAPKTFVSPIDVKDATCLGRFPNMPNSGAPLERGDTRAQWAPTLPFELPDDFYRTMRRS